jgi:transcription elongation factor Elf1
MTTADAPRWFYFKCDRCGHDSNVEGFLLDDDYSGCWLCLDCQLDRDVEIPMSFRPADEEEERRLEKRKYLA